MADRDNPPGPLEAVKNAFKQWSGAPKKSVQTVGGNYRLAQAERAEKGLPPQTLKEYQEGSPTQP
jgi:hypothetical protein